MSWYPHRERENVLFLYYEDLHEDLGACVNAIAEFMDVELNAMEKARVLDKSSHSFMSKPKDQFDCAPIAREMRHRLNLPGVRFDVLPNIEISMCLLMCRP